MGKLHACFVVAVSALAACGDDGGNAKADAGMPDSGPDAKVFMDAPPPMFDFSCAGNAAPTTATANVTLTGDVTRISVNGITPMFNALGGATLKACRAGTNCSGQDELDMDTSMNDGSFTLGPIATTGVPLDAYISMTATNSRPTYTYPAQPFVADQGNIPILTFDPALIANLGLLGCTQNDTGNGIVGLAVTDCADAPITESQDITLTVKQNGAAVSGTSLIDLGTLDARAAGTFLICNVPANAGTTTTEVGGTYKTTMQLRAHNVKVVAGATTGTILRPGY
jgi:hypothetical protein